MRHKTPREIAVVLREALGCTCASRTTHVVYVIHELASARDSESSVGIMLEMAGVIYCGVGKSKAGYRSSKAGDSVRVGWSSADRTSSARDSRVV